MRIGINFFRVNLTLLAVRKELFDAQRKRLVNNLELAYRSVMLDSSTPSDIFQQKSRNFTSKKRWMTRKL